LAGNETGANQTITSADLNLVPGIAGQNTAAANAEMQGSANLWNFGLNAAKLGVGGAGNAAGGAGTYSNFGNALSPAGWNSFRPMKSLTGA
jgi:hypothetical protein